MNQIVLLLLFDCSSFNNSGHKSAVSVLKFDDTGGRLVSGSRVLISLKAIIFIMVQT